LDKISLEIELLVSDPSGKNKLALVVILHTSILSIQNNPSTCSSLPSLSYKFSSPSSILEFKKLTVEIEEDNNVDSNVKIQLLSSQ